MKRLSAPDRRNQILHATAQLVAEHGFHAISIEAVAQAAGISRPIVYEHFGDLAGLLEALVSQMMERALAQLSAVLPGRVARSGGADALVTALAGYLEVVRADPGTWRLVLMPPEGTPALLREAIAIGRQAVVENLAETVRPGLGVGLGSPDPELTATMLSSLADESARLVLTNPDDFPIGRLVAHARWFLDRD